MEGPEKGELNLEGAHLPSSKIKKTHPTCQASQESQFSLLNSKSQNSTAPDPGSLPPLFKEYSSLRSSGFSGHINDFLFYPQVLNIEKSLLDRALERTLQVQTLLMPFVTLSTLSTTALKPPVKASTFSYLISFGATRVGPLVASANSFRTSHLWWNSLPLNKYFKHTVEKERPLRPLPPSDLPEIAWRPQEPKDVFFCE